MHRCGPHVLFDPGETPSRGIVIRSEEHCFTENVRASRGGYLQLHFAIINNLTDRVFLRTGPMPIICTQSVGTTYSDGFVMETFTVSTETCFTPEYHLLDGLPDGISWPSDYGCFHVTHNLRLPDVHNDAEYSDVTVSFHLNYYPIGAFVPVILNTNKTIRVIYPAVGSAGGASAIR